MFKKFLRANSKNMADSKKGKHAHINKTPLNSFYIATAFADRGA